MDWNQMRAIEFDPRLLSPPIEQNEELVISSFLINPTDNFGQNTQQWCHYPY